MIQGREWGSLYLHLATLAFSVFAETHSTELSSWRFTLPTLLLPQTTHTQYYLSHGRRYKVESSSSSCCFCFHQPSPSHKLDNKVKNYTFIIDSLQTQRGISCSPNSLESRAKDFSFPILLVELWYAEAVSQKLFAIFGVLRLNQSCRHSLSSSDKKTPFFFILLSLIRGLEGNA